MIDEGSIIIMIIMLNQKDMQNVHSPSFGLIYFITSSLNHWIKGYDLYAKVKPKEARPRSTAFISATFMK